MHKDRKEIFAALGVIDDALIGDLDEAQKKLAAGKQQEGKA